MTIIKTKDLTGTALDWAVAKAEKIRVVVPQCWQNCEVKNLAKIAAAKAFPYGPPAWEPSQNWEQGGPIIEREKLMLKPHLIGGVWHGEWRSVCLSWKGRNFADVTADTPLMAAMRCYVCAKIGDEMSVPNSILSSAKAKP